MILPLPLTPSSFLSCRSELSALAKKCGITFYPLDGVYDQSGHQQWSHIDGKQSRRLLQELCEKEKLHSFLMTPSPGETGEMLASERAHRLRCKAKFETMFDHLSFVQKFLTSPDRRTEEEIEEFEMKGKELYRIFVRLDKKNAGKWYLHLLAYHIGDQLRQEKSIAPYTCSSQERVNGQNYRMLQTCVQFHNSSRQLLEMKRMECKYHFVLPQYARKTSYLTNRKSVPIQEGREKMKSEPLGEKLRRELKKSKKRVLPIM
tara:strand:+ start:1382 stop:2164 length:783 start_codon:yes stop_codon:yes gene_type:complete